MNPTQLLQLLENLCALRGEQEWVEFKENNIDPDMVAATVSALANGARLRGKTSGYFVWGIRDSDHVVVGTSFCPETAKKGNEALEHWLVRSLTPRLNLRFHSIEVEGKCVVVLEVPAAMHTPVQCSGCEYIRVGSLNKKLKDYPEKARDLWQALNVTPFEQGVARSGLEPDDILQLLDYPKYFELSGQPLPAGKEGILERLAVDGLVIKGLQGWAVSRACYELRKISLCDKCLQVISRK